MNGRSYSGWALLPDLPKPKPSSFILAIRNMIRDDGEEHTAKVLRYYAEALDGKAA